MSVIPTKRTRNRLIGAAAGTALLTWMACGGSESTPASPSGANGFIVQAITTSVDSPSFVGTCPHRFTFTGTITVSAPGTATYRWERSDGTIGPTQNLTFSERGSETQTTTWDVATTIGGWVRVRALGPNELASNQASFSLTCTTSTFAVTAASLGVGSATVTGTCPHRFVFTGTITANGPGSVTYRWERSDGTKGAVQTVSFTAAGTSTQSVTDSWDVAASGNAWEQLHVLTPNELTSNQVAVSLNCTAGT